MAGSVGVFAVLDGVAALWPGCLSRVAGAEDGSMVVGRVIKPRYRAR